MPSYRIAVLLEHTRMTGEILSTLDLAQRLAGRGHAVEVFTTNPPPTWTRVTVPVHHVARFDERDIPESDFVLGTSWVTAAATIGVRRGLPLHYAARPVRTSLGPDERRAYELPTFKFTPSGRHQRLLQTRFHTRCWHLPLAIDPSRFDPRLIDARRAADSPPPWRIVLVGDDVPGRGIRTGLEVVTRLRATGHDVELTRVGAQSMSDTDARITDRWLGPVSPASMPAVLSRMHVFLGTTDDADAVVSRVAFDAIAAGAAPILTDVPCHHDVASGDAHALFVPPGDADAMARSAERVLTDPSLRARLFEAGRQVVAQRGWDTYMDRFENMLAEIHDAHQVPYMLGRSRRTVDASRSIGSCIREPQYELAGQMAGRRRVLVAGCGRGDELRPVLKAGPREVVAIDCSELAIAHARKSGAHPDVRFEVADATRTAYEDGSFDLILAFDLLEEVEDAHALLRESARLLSPHGAFLMSVPCRPSDAIRRGTADPTIDTTRPSTSIALRQLLESYFDRATLFGERHVDDTLFLKPEPFEEADCVAIVAMAVRKQQHPTPETAERDAQSRRAA